MKPSGFYDVSIASGAAINLLVHGDYFKIMSASGPITVRSDFGELKALIAGQGLEDTPFAYLTLVNTTGATNAVRVFVGDEKFIDGMSGQVSISGTADVNVTSSQFGSCDNQTYALTTSVSTLRNAYSSRKFLHIANRSTTNTVWFYFGSSLSIDAAIHLKPGESWESGAFVPSQAVYGGCVTGTATVAVIEGF